MLQIQIILMLLKLNQNEIKRDRETDENRGGNIKEEKEKDWGDLIRKRDNKGFHIDFSLIPVLVICYCLSEFEDLILYNAWLT